MPRVAWQGGAQVAVHVACWRVQTLRGQAWDRATGARGRDRDRCVHRDQHLVAALRQAHPRGRRPGRPSGDGAADRRHAPRPRPRGHLRGRLERRHRPLLPPARAAGRLDRPPARPQRRRLGHDRGQPRVRADAERRHLPGRQADLRPDRRVARGDLRARGPDRRQPLPRLPPGRSAGGDGRRRVRRAAGERAVRAAQRQHRVRGPGRTGPAGEDDRAPVPGGAGGRRPAAAAGGASGATSRSRASPCW